MSIFKKKNKLELPKPNYPTPTFEPKQELNIPRFPEPNFSESFPTYKPIIPKHDIENIKEAVKPRIELIRDDLDEDILSAPLPKSKKEEIPGSVFEQKTIYESKSPENPLFVKINTYEEAIKEIELIKDNISKINEIINNLETIKRQEDREIEQWKDRVSKIKEKVMFVDKNLFEKR